MATLNLQAIPPSPPPSSMRSLGSPEPRLLVKRDSPLEGNEAKNIWNELYKTFMMCYRNELIRLARSNYNKDEVTLPQCQKTDIKMPWSYYSDMSFIAPYRSKDDPELERLVQLAKPIVLTKGQEYKLELLQQQQQQKLKNEIVISSVSAETQTPQEDVLMDVPLLVEENMSEKEMCLRSFFDAMFRATNTLPVHLQSKVKLEILESVSNAEIKADWCKYRKLIK
ncbi:uncharacterized protein [Eurosta solidaginis]|uniref:uncharacterized protein isoform X1 n=1 Tax=Eurosta solidaginis TaxID=178769 RepID=UPI00353085A4